MGRQFDPDEIYARLDTLEETVAALKGEKATGTVAAGDGPNSGEVKAPKTRRVK